MHYEFNFTTVNYIDVYNSKIKHCKEPSGILNLPQRLNVLFYTFLCFLTYDNRENDQSVNHLRLMFWCRTR